MELLYILLVLLVLTRGFGEIAIRFKQPPLVGELLAGILLGMVAGHFSGTFPVLADLTDNEVFMSLTDLGIFFLMLLGGIEMRPRQIVQESGGSLIVALSAMLLPLGAGLALGYIFLPESEYKLAQALFLGTGLAITAVPVAIRVLLDLNLLDTRPGQLIVSAAVYDDILSLVLLAVLTGIIKTGGLPDLQSLLFLIGQILIFGVVTVALGLYVLPRVHKMMMRYVKLDELELSLLLIVALGFSVLAEHLGMHFILGAFAAGLFFSRRVIEDKVYEEVKQKISGITTGFLAPLFFASIGMHLDLSAFTAIPLFLFVLIAVAFLTKLVGASVPARLIGLSGRNSLAVGVAMSSRGAVELIIADIALRAGLFELPDPAPPIIANMFSAIVIVAIITTVVVPIVMRPLMSGRSGHKRR